MKARQNLQTRARRGDARQHLLRGINEHVDACMDSLRRLLNAPLHSLMTLLVIAVALSFPAMLYMMVKSIDQSIAEVHHSADISVYLEPGTSPQQSMDVQARIIAEPGVEAARFLSPQKALQEFQQYSGLGDVLTHLSDNPLPPTLLVMPKLDHADISGLIHRLAQFERVDQVEFDYLWVQRLQALVATAEKMVTSLTALLGLGVILILGNTIRLEIENRREEVVIIKLVGGTDAYVRRPLIYTGAWYGLVGATLAWCVTNLFALAMSAPLDSLGGLYLTDLSLAGLHSRDLLILILIGLFLGISGAWLAVARHLASIEPI